MLVKINPLLGANSDARCRTINVLRAIKAVATCAANTAPTCNVISGPSGTFEANQMITVISNTSAGGWSVDTNADIGNTYSDSYSSPYNLHLYNDSGKGTYPYKAFTLRTNPSYAFNSSFTSYPVLTAYYGCSNTTVWNSGSYNANFSSGEDSYMTTGTQLFDTQGNWSSYLGSGSLGTYAQSTSYYQYPCMYQAGEFYMAATSDYLIFLQPNSYFMYCGTRFTQGWEDDYSDNPPVVGLFMQRWNQPQSVWGWARVMNTSNTATSGPFKIRHKIHSFGDAPASYSNSNYHPLHPISGTNRYPGSSSSSSQYGSREAARMFNYQAGGTQYYYGHPSAMFFAYGHTQFNSHIYSGNWSSSGAPYAPVYDSASGLLVPPAIPIIFQYYGTEFNPGGRLKGIYKSLSGANAFVGIYASTDQDFNVANSTGGTEAHRIVALGLSASGIGGNIDTFLIRKT